MNNVPKPTDAELVAEVRAWLAQNWNGGRNRDPGWLAKVVAARWAVPRWPTEWYGRGLCDAQARLIEREFQAVGAHGTGQDRSNLWANTALAYATPEFKAEIVPALLRDEVKMCLLYSEPGAGSDLAGVRTRADNQGDHFIVNGQKVWTSSAADADYGMLVARTNWDVPKHKGIGFFFLPMKQAGIEVRPLRQITNEAHFNEVFITDAVVPAANLLGAPTQGWEVLQTALAYERSVMGDRARGPRSGAGGGPGKIRAKTYPFPTNKHHHKVGSQYKEQHGKYKKIEVSKITSIMWRGLFMHVGCRVYVDQ